MNDYTDDEMADNYDEGYADGMAASLGSAMEHLVRNPAAIFDAVRPYQFQSTFDAIKAEAMRLGVKP